MNFTKTGNVLGNKTFNSTITLLVMLFLVVMSVFPLQKAEAQVNDFTFSGTAAITSERGGPNLGADFSRTGVHTIVSAKVQHKSCAFVEGTTGNGNDNWNYIHEVSAGCIKKLFGGKLLARFDGHLIYLDGTQRDQEIISVRNVIKSNFDTPVNFTLFNQYVIDGPAGEGLATRVQLNLPFNALVEAGIQCGFLDNDDCVHAFNRYGVQQALPNLGKTTLFVGYLDMQESAKRTTVSENRWQLELKTRF